MSDSDITLSEILENTFSEEKEETTFGAMIDELDQHGMAIVLILFSIPSALPVPAAGYSTLLSIPLFIIAFSLLLRKQTVWLPEKVRSKSFNPGEFKGKKLMLKVVRFVEKFSKPRLKWLSQSQTTRSVLGLLIFLLASFMAVPIPGTNTLPAGGIFLIGFGMLEDDGLFIILGILYSLMALALGVLILFLGKEIVKHAILNFI